VLVADSDVEMGKALASTLVDWGVQALLVHDGVEAILTIQRTLPTVVILDAALPKMFGFQICELMKRNQSLREIRVVLVGAIHHRERYRRPPSELYGADAYVERPQLPEALRPILRGLGLPIGGGIAEGRARPDPGEGVRARHSRPVTPQPAEAPSPDPAPQPPQPPPAPRAPSAPQSPPAPRAPSAPQSPPTPRAASAPQSPPIPQAPSATESAPGPMPGDPLGAEIAKAERLARIIVSDIVLYNQEKFDAAVHAGNVVEALDGEMEEARAHFCQRIDAGVRESRDFLAEELLRVARKRGMT
jgi:CheY-like chemotaxis protein